MARISTEGSISMWIIALLVWIIAFEYGNDECQLENENKQETSIVILLVTEYLSIQLVFSTLRLDIFKLEFT